MSNSNVIPFPRRPSDLRVRLFMAFAIVFLPGERLIRAARKAWFGLDPETKDMVREITK